MSGLLSERTGIHTAFAALAAMILVLAASGMPASRAQTLDATEQAEAAVSALTHLGLGAVQKLAPEAANGTVILSPVSLSVALAMAAQGAAGETAMAFHALLSGTSANDPDTATDPSALATAFESVLGALAADAGPNRFSTAQALWVAADIALKPAFTDTLARRFDARAEPVSFGDPATLEAINGWVAEKTDGLIPTLTDRLAPDLAMLLANAIAFEGRWLKEFDPAETRDRPFQPAAGPARDVPMMHRTGEKMRYAEDDHAQLVQLPYQGDLLALTVILPKAPGTAEAWLQGLADGAALAEQIAAYRFSEQEGSLALPRLDVRYAGQMKAVLAALGLGIAFTPGADFSGMSDDALRIDEVLHKVALKADEKGTKAAAVTGVLITRTAAIVTKPFEMVVDRPFLLALTHVPTGALLFFGIVGDPGP